MKKIGVLLSGCGVYDGSEIHEAVITLLAIDRAGAQAVCMAPDVAQLHVIDHLKGEPVAGESRNVLVESARIARGNIKSLAEANIADFDALILPGGFGAAKNLCDFAVNGSDCTVNPQVEALLKATVAAGKPLAAVCIAPALLARVLGPDYAPQLTIGTDEGTAGAVETMGAKHLSCPVRECVIDEQHKIITSPAYMLAGRISEAADGIEKTVKALIGML